MYEQYPYPAGTPQVRIQTDARLLLSYVSEQRSASGPLRVLDAGCGRGLGVIGTASTQPDVQFVGADMNRIALQHARQRADEYGLANLELVECDLMTLEGLKVPEGGFDVIYSLGVLHHMSDPETGLRRLRDILAPHGVIALMVYAKYGRSPLTRLQQGMKIMFPNGESLAERIPAGRDLARHTRTGILSNTYWADTAETHDIEFVDRCLNVNEAAYSIDQFWDLMESARLQFVRWFEPADWAAEQLPDGEVRQRAALLSELDRFRLIEQVTEQNALELILSHKSNPPRPPVTPETARRLAFALNPDVAITVETRHVRGGQRIESLQYRLRHRLPVTVSGGPLAAALLMLREQGGTFSGTDFIVAMLEHDVPQDAALRTLCEMVRKEILFSPHETEL